MLARKIQVGSFSIAISTSIVAISGSASAIEPAHVTWAEDVATHVAPEYNDYGYNPTYARWAGTDGAVRYENRAVCNTFITIILQKAYGFTDTQFRTWMGATSPLASTYHDEILAQDGFTSITHIGAVQIGDIIAIKYPAGSSVSGHMMIVTTPPTARLATRPLQTNTYQYEVEVVDSSSSNHGTLDTRVMTDGTIDAGVGIGGFRIYTDANGAFAGYTWSTSTGSTYYDQATRHMAIGRLTNTGGTSAASTNGGGGNDNNGKHIGDERKLGGYDFTLELQE